VGRENMKIYVFDSWRKFWDGMVEGWREQGHEVRTGPYWGPELTEWSDISIFHPIQDNLRQYLKRQAPLADTRVFAEAIDVDIYTGNTGMVARGDVEGVVFMAEHMRQYANERHGAQLANVPQYVVPGGVDLRRYTLRKQRERGYNVAWVGRLWIAKNVFGALQIFNDLITRYPGHPWHLYLRGDKYSPPHWWRRHVEAYLEVNQALRDRVTWTPVAQDMNDWYEDKDWLLQTSLKEAMGYVVLEALAKGIQPVIQMTTGALDIWPREWVFQTHDQAVTKMLRGGEEPEELRSWVAAHYPLEKRLAAWGRVIGLED